MSLLILVVDDEPDVEALFRQQFRRDIRDGRFSMDFAQSADSALKLTQATLDCWQGRGVCKLPAKRRKVAATSEANE